MSFRNFVARSLLLLAILDWGMPTVYAEALPSMGATFAKQPPRIDGVIGREEWAGAVPVFFPQTGEAVRSPQPYPGEIRVAWTKEGLYLAFQGIERNPVWGRTSKGSPLYQEDVFEFFLDPTGDHRQYVEVQLSPGGQAYFKNYVLTAPLRLTLEKRLTQEFVESELWRYEIPSPENFKTASRLDRKTHLWTLEAFFPAAFVNRRQGGGALTPGKMRVNFARYDWDRALGDTARQPRYFYWSPVLQGCPHISPTSMGYLILKP